MKRRCRSPRHLVVFRPGQFGDTLVAFPAIEALAQLFPEASIIYCTERFRSRVLVRGEAVARLSPVVNNTATYYVEDPPWMKWQSLRQQLRPRKDDLLVYLSYAGITPRQVVRDWLVFFSMGFRRFCGFRPALKWARQNEIFFELPREADRLLQSLQAAGLPVKAPETCRVLKDEAWAAQRWAEWGLGSSPVLAVCPGTKMQSKRWPLERFLEVGQRWHNRTGAALVIVGGPEDAESAHSLIQEWPGYGFSACGAELSQTAAVLARAAAYCGNDTGNMHLAAIMGIPCVALFSARRRPRLWHPYGEHHVVLRHDLACASCEQESCFHDPSLCMDKISVPEVLAALEQIWSKPNTDDQPREAMNLFPTGTG